MAVLEVNNDTSFQVVDELILQKMIKEPRTIIVTPKNYKNNKTLSYRERKRKAATVLANW